MMLKAVKTEKLLLRPHNVETLMPAMAVESINGKAGPNLSPNAPNQLGQIQEKGLASTKGALIE